MSHMFSGCSSDLKLKVKSQINLKNEAFN
jgi:hypothetical protein